MSLTSIPHVFSSSILSDLSLKVIHTTRTFHTAQDIHQKPGVLKQRINLPYRLLGMGLTKLLSGLRLGSAAKPSKKVHFAEFDDIIPIPGRTPSQRSRSKSAPSPLLPDCLRAGAGPSSKKVGKRPQTPSTEATSDQSRPSSEAQHSDDAVIEASRYDIPEAHRYHLSRQTMRNPSPSPSKPLPPLPSQTPSQAQDNVCHDSSLHNYAPPHLWFCPSNNEIRRKPLPKTVIPTPAPSRSSSTTDRPSTVPARSSSLNTQSSRTPSPTPTVAPQPSTTAGALSTTTAELLSSLLGRSSSTASSPPSTTDESSVPARRLPRRKSMSGGFERRPTRPFNSWAVPEVDFEDEFHFDVESFFDKT